MRRRFVLALVLECVAAAPSPAGAAASAAILCGDVWTLTSSPPAKNLNGFDAIDASDVWAVGIAFGAPEQTFTEHWDGGNWSVHASSNAGAGDNAFNDVSMVSSTDGWAVGYYANGRDSETTSWQTLVERWNGSTWAIVPSPSPSPGSNSLIGVDAVASNNVWAVGYHKTDALRTTLILHWNGVSWSPETGQDPGTVSNGLMDVEAISGSDVWAVGYQSSGSGYQTLIEHWNGSGWSAVGSPNPGKTSVLTAIAGVSANDIWAVGYQGDGTSYRSLVEHWDGVAWSVVPSQNRNAGADVLMDVGTAGTGDGWAVGFSFDETDQSVRTLTEHWDGAAWTIQPSPNGDGEGSSILGGTVLPGKVAWAGGRSGPAGLMMSTCSGGGAATASSLSNEPTSTGSPRRLEGSDRRAGRPADAVGVMPTAAQQAATAAVPVVAVDKAGPAGVFELTRSFGAVIFDANGDGWQDIFLGRHQNSARLYLNGRNATFSEIDAGMFGRHDRHGCDQADVNQDGLPDVFCAVGANKGTDLKQNELWIQAAGGGFTNQSGPFGVADLFGRGRNVTFIDVNRDRYPDVYVGNEGDRPDGLPAPSHLFLNLGGSGFREAPEFGLDLETGSGCGQAQDFNNDGWQDLLLCTHTGLKLYRNEQGSGFTDVARAMRIAHNPSDAQFADVNGDGLLDVVEVTRTRLRVNVRSGSRFTIAFQQAISNGTGVATGDVYGDHLPDLYVLLGGTSSNGADLMLLNGGGTTFSPMTIPQTNQGRAESVRSIDYDRNGLTDFLVLNGNSTSAGPVQLIAFFPA
jgi:hypothetical protein